MSESLTLGDLTFELRRSPRRQTVGITVERDGHLVLVAPPDCSEDQMIEIATAKRIWIYTKLAQKDLLRRPSLPRDYVSGEGFPYLGRYYRLLLVDPDSQDQALRLHQGRFCLRRDKRSEAPSLFATWYAAHGTPWLHRRATQFVDRIDATPDGIDVRDLGHRWGSCTPSGKVSLHWRTMQFPPRIIEYVLVHELVHLKEPHHGPAFWQLLRRVLPDFATCKEWLALNGDT